MNERASSLPPGNGKASTGAYARLRIGLVLLFALLATACGGGSGAPGAPSALAASYNAPFLEVTLTWTPPPGSFSGYSLEAEQGNQGFQPLSIGIIDPHATGIILTFKAPPPEAITIQFRLQAVNGSSSSGWSNSAAIQTPVLAPIGGLAPFAPGTPAVSLAWTGNSSVATQVRVERAPADQGESPTGPWAVLATQSAQVQSFTDTAIQENLHFAYRITNLDGALASDPCLILMPWSIPLFLPANLRGTTLAQGIRLDWRNVSAVATSITVLRGSGSQAPATVLAVLGPQAQTFTDTSANLGYFSYALAITDGTLTATTASALAMAPNPPGAVAMTGPSVLGGELGWCGAAMRPDGTWALAVNYGPLGIQAAPGLWPQWLSTGVGWSRNPLQIDPQGWPELLYFGSDGQNPGATLEKEVFDGSGWGNTRLAGSIVSNGAAPDYVWRQDATGAIHALVTTYNLDSNDYRITAVSYLHASTGGSVLTPLATLLPGLPTPTGSRIFVDSADAPHLLVKVPGEFDECWPAADGTWTRTAILAGPGADEIQDFAALGTGPDEAWVLATSAAWYGQFPANVQAFHKVGGIWQAPQQVYALPAPSYPDCGGLAQSPDGSRTAVLIADSGVGLGVLVHSGTTWIPTLVAPPLTMGMGIGFDAAGVLHVLGYDTVGMQLVEYHE